MVVESGPWFSHVTVPSVIVPPVVVPQVGARRRRAGCFHDLNLEVGVEDLLTHRIGGQRLPGRDISSVDASAGARRRRSTRLSAEEDQVVGAVIHFRHRRAGGFGAGNGRYWVPLPMTLAPIGTW